MVDRWLGRFLDRMDELDLFENTLLILLSDHGHALGEHGYTGKPHYALWPELTDIVFMIRHPGKAERGDQRPLRLHPRRGPNHPGLPRHRARATLMEGRTSPCYSKAQGPEQRPTSL